MNGFTRNGVLISKLILYIIDFNRNLLKYCQVLAKNATYQEFMQKNYPANFKYSDFAPRFTTEFFEPQKWAKLFKQSGVVLTSKHHDGYALWPSKRSAGWNSVDIGPKRDLVGQSF